MYDLLSIMFLCKWSKLFYWILYWMKAGRFYFDVILYHLQCWICKIELKAAVYLRNLSYRWPDATEKMLMTSSFSCLGSSGFEPPVNPLKEMKKEPLPDKYCKWELLNRQHFVPGYGCPESRVVLMGIITKKFLFHHIRLFLHLQTWYRATGSMHEIITSQ